MDKRSFRKTIAFGVLSSVITIILIGYEVSALPGPGEEAIREVEITGMWKGYHCGYTEAARLVIKTEDRWKEVWGKVHLLRLPQQELPKIDFQEEMVIAVFMGERKSGGYEIEIRKIMKTEKEIVVEVEEKEPSPESFKSMAITQPYHIVVVKSSPLPIRFQHP